MMRGRNHLLMTHTQHLNKSFLISFSRSSAVEQPKDWVVRALQANQQQWSMGSPIVLGFSLYQCQKVVFSFLTIEHVIAISTLR